jgi:hypothetical protein
MAERERLAANGEKQNIEGASAIDQEMKEDIEDDDKAITLSDGDDLDKPDENQSDDEIMEEVQMIEIDDNTNNKRNNDSSSVQIDNFEDEDQDEDEMQNGGERNSKSKGGLDLERIKRLEREANLRIGYGMPMKFSDEEEDLEDENKQHGSNNKKKAKHKKSSGGASAHKGDSRLKQTRLVFTPNLAGTKRGAESPIDISEDEEQ